MLSIIGDFKFEINDTNYDKFTSSTNFRFATHARLGNFDEYQDVGKHEESIEIEGVLIAKSQTQLKDFEVMAKKKEPVTIAFGDGTCKTILIFNIEKERNTFLKDGAFLKQTYKIALTVVGDGYSNE